MPPSSLVLTHLVTQLDRLQSNDEARAAEHHMHPADLPLDERVDFQQVVHSRYTSPDEQLVWWLRLVMYDLPKRHNEGKPARVRPSPSIPTTRWPAERANPPRAPQPLFRATGMLPFMPPSHGG